MHSSQSPDRNSSPSRYRNELEQSAGTQYRQGLEQSAQRSEVFSSSTNNLEKAYEDLEKEILEIKQKLAGSVNQSTSQHPTTDNTGSRPYLHGREIQH